jgi:hypothetical protein
MARRGEGCERLRDRKDYEITKLRDGHLDTRASDLLFGLPPAPWWRADVDAPQSPPSTVGNVKTSGREIPGCSKSLVR